MEKHKLQHTYTDELCETQNKKKHKKHKKHKNKEQLEIETVATQDNCQISIPAKCQKDQSEMVESNETVQNMSHTSSCKKKKKKKKKSYTSEELDEHTGGNKAKLLEDELLAVPNKKKKHKHKKRHNENSTSEDLERDPESNKNKVSNYMNQSEEHVNNDECINSVHEVKTGENMHVKKKKKHKRNHCENEHPSSEMEMMMDNIVKDTTDDYPPKKKSKKKHRKKSLDTSEIGVNEDVSFTNNTERSNLVSDGGNQVKKGPVGAVDKNMSTEEQYSCQSNDKPVAHMPTMAGQWKTASFGSEERQTKFLKLLGAFKKEGVTNNKLNFAKAIPGNVAMTTKEENNYRNVMTNEYEKALGFNIQRGTGLGFEKPAAEGKKFHIDINKSRSVKFDD